MKFKKMTVINCESKISPAGFERLASFSEKFVVIKDNPASKPDLINANRGADGVIISLMVPRFQERCRAS